MKFFVIVQDLRITGTSEGIVSRSFLSKLRKAYPEAIIDVLYLKNHESDDQVHLLPVNHIQSIVLNLKIPFITKWINKLNWRIFHVSLKERHIHKMYAGHIVKVKHQEYDHVFIRSSGINHESLLAAKDLPILKRAIINFHDPFPLFWYSGGKAVLSNLELFRLKQMEIVVSQAKKCITPSSLLSQDMQFLYASKKQFYTLPHQYDDTVFDLQDVETVLSKQKKVTISYHGAIMFGRNIDVFLDAYQELLQSNSQYKENTEIILRLRGQDNKRLREKYSEAKNIIIADTLSFSKSCYEQINEADICIILENGPLYSNVLVGKAPFLASLSKPILSLSPSRSEMRVLVKDQKYITSNVDKEEIKQKLETLIKERMQKELPIYPFGDYFSDKNFKRMLDVILFE